MLTIEKPGIFTKLRGRFGVRSGPPQQARLYLGILPVTQADELALESRIYTLTISISAVVQQTFLTCPNGEFWRCRRLVGTQDGGDYSWRVFIEAENYVTPSIQAEVALANLVASGADPALVNMNGITMRPGDRIRLDVPVHVTTGDYTMALLFDREDCSS